MKPTRDEIVKLAREIYAKRYYDVEPWKGCLYWAYAFEKAARKYGVFHRDVLIQAGSAQFQFRADDGVHDTHFSYMYDPSTAIQRVRAGLLPEMHVWNAVRSDEKGEWEYVDLTTRYQAQQAKLLQGFDWEPEFALPDYYWGRPQGNRLIYRADANATMCVAMQMLMERKRNSG